jgi:hypothetical protein
VSRSRRRCSAPLHLNPKSVTACAQRHQAASPLQLLVVLSSPEELSDANFEPTIFTAPAGSELTAAEAWLPISPWASILGAGQCHQDLHVVKLHILRRPSSPSRRRNIATRAHTNCQPPSRLRSISSRSNPSSSLVSTSTGSPRSPHSKEPRHRSPSCPGGRRLQQPDPPVAISSVCRASNPGSIRLSLPLLSTSVDSP